MRTFGLMGALLASSALGMVATPAERRQGRFMRAPDHGGSWPAWYYGPDGAQQVFQSEAEVPAGWSDHPSKVISPARTGSKPVAPVVDRTTPAERGAAPVPAKNEATDTATGGAAGDKATRDVSNELDADGWAWDAEKHSGKQTKTTAGLWRMKVGVKRPDPKPGFPKPVLDL